MITILGDSVLIMSEQPSKSRIKAKSRFKKAQKRLVVENDPSPQADKEKHSQPQVNTGKTEEFFPAIKGSTNRHC